MEGGGNPYTKSLPNNLGISISSGNYINTLNPKDDNRPTWQKIAESGGQAGPNAAFYSNTFGIQAPKRDNNMDANSKIPEYLKIAGQRNDQKRPYGDISGGDQYSPSGGVNTNYQAPFKVGGEYAQRRDHKQIDRAFQQKSDMNNMDENNKARL